MREHVDHVQPHQRGEADRRPHVIGENQECRAERYRSAMRGETIQDRPHRVLAHAKVQVAAGKAPAAALRPLAITGARAGRLEVTESCECSEGRRIEIRGTSYQRRYARRDRIHDLPRCDACGNAFGVGGEARNVRIPVRGQFAAKHLAEFAGKIGKRLRVRRKPVVPCGFGLFASFDRLSEMREHRLGDQERWVLRPVQIPLGRAHFVDAQRRTMRLERVLLVG